MKSTIDTFKDGIDKAFTTQPNVKLNSDTMMDAQKYKSSFVEEMDSDGNEYETFLEKNKKLKTSAIAPLEPHSISKPLECPRYHAYENGSESRSLASRWQPISWLPSACTNLPCL